tara:strand:+ start:55 stop:435 length:381 start_codon:yes stop_codon:yes gene_type:complete
MEIPGSMPGNSFSLNNAGQGIPIGRTPKITPQQFLGNALSFFIPKGSSAYHNRDLLGKAFQGDPTAIGQSMINVGGTFAGPAGYSLIGADQLMKKTMGQGIVEGWKDPRVIDAYSRTGLAGYGGLF